MTDKVRQKSSSSSRHHNYTYRPSILKLLYWILLASSLLICLYMWMANEHHHHQNNKIIQPNVYLTISDVDSSSSQLLKRREILIAMTDPSVPDIADYSRSIFNEVNDFDLSSDTPISPHNQYHHRHHFHGHHHGSPDSRDGADDEFDDGKIWPDVFWQNQIDRRRQEDEEENEDEDDDGNGDGDQGENKKYKFLLADTLHNPSENGKLTSPMVFVEPAKTTTNRQLQRDIHGGTTTSASRQQKQPRHTLLEQTQEGQSFQERLNHLETYCRSYLNQSQNVRLKGSLKGKKTMWIQYKTKISDQNQAKTNKKKNLLVQWCPIYKSGSSPWMAMFMKMKSVLTPRTEQMILRGKMTFVKLARMFHLSVDRPRTFLSENQRDLQNKNVDMSLIVVRHPFERILSAYRDKLERLHGRSYYNKKYGLPIIRKFRKKTDPTSSSWRPQSLMTQRMMGTTTNNHDGIQSPVSDSDRNVIPTFSEFVQFLLTQTPTQMDEHWRPIFVDCNACWGPRFNLILKVETMDRDRDYFLKLIGLTPPAPTTSISNNGNSSRDDNHDTAYSKLDKVWKRWANSVSRTGNGSSYADRIRLQWRRSQAYFSQVSKTNIKKLYKLYQPDFNMFNYSAEPYIQIGA